jgi:hypothetical protein
MAFACSVSKFYPAPKDSAMIGQLAHSLTLLKKQEEGIREFPCTRALLVQR